MREEREAEKLQSRREREEALIERQIEREEAQRQREMEREELLMQREDEREEARREHPNLFVNCFVLYDGEWRKDDNGVSFFDSSSLVGVPLSLNTTYDELTDIVYDAIGVDKLRYDLVFKVKEMALMAVRGTVEESYGKLPSYLFMLAKNNPGTITDIQTDEHGHFRYCRPVLCVDVSFLKHKIGGQLLVAIVLDANEQLYSVAFGVIYSENNNSWTYFMQQLRVTIGVVPDLVFVYDRHPSIANALSGEMESCIFPGSRYNQMTSNYAESFNSQCRDARKYPISTLAEYLRLTLQEWFHNKREKAFNHTERLSSYYEKFLREQAEKARFYNVNPFNRYEFHVNDGEHDFQVDFQTRTCTCRVFNISGLPCKHALVVVRSRKTIPYEYYSRFFTTQAWCVAYEETIYPVCNEGSRDISENIKERVYLKPPVKVKKGRTTTKRRPSQGEPYNEQRRCNSCGSRGNNRATCKAVMPAPSTVRQQVSQPS
ncbi:uncharacterized protein LOC124929451 [Impatiens glandulifera]|uniref:uncharacterized protein LOC124929451 n=1 Tax=Impatiens glandulifera TaxID=253017 RepID=UPI001FB0A310|nr:uncharacterized protein LOC124929451 [Impatiens glandulifera]